MPKLPYLNIGCGNKYHKDWTNIDMKSASSKVLEVDILKGLPFEDNTFEVIYSSQLVEHIPLDKIDDFIRECYRILRPNGIIRIVVPDLENIIQEYVRLLQELRTIPNAQAEANYHWILLELFDQVSRHQSGGEMERYLNQLNIPNEEYIIDRIGYNGRYLRARAKGKLHQSVSSNWKSKIKKIIHPKYLRTNLLRLVLNKQERAYLRIGEFRQGGEIHFWMYDGFSLQKLLEKHHFQEVERRNYKESKIEDWGIYELDVKEELAYDPTSLFMEATK